MRNNRKKPGAILCKGLLMAGITVLLWAGSMIVGNASGTETEAQHMREEHISISLPEAKLYGKNTEYVNYEGAGKPDVILDDNSNHMPVYSKETAADIVVTDKGAGIRTCVWILQQGNQVTTGHILVDNEGTLSGDTTGWQAVYDGNRVLMLSNSNFSLNGEGSGSFLLMEMTDVAGFITYDVKYYSIDTTAPKIQVSYDNNDVKNGKYFNNSRTATFLVSDSNADASSVQVQVKKDGQKMQGLSDNIKWKTVTGGVRGTLLLSQDGSYQLEVSAEDLVGNKSGEAVWKGEAPQSFVIDTIIEDPVITGITDQAVYDGNVSGSFRGTDDHFLRGEVTLTRTTMDVTEKGAVFYTDQDVKEKFVSDFKVSSEGFSGKVSDMENIRENDGFYTLTLVMEDLAGNRTEKNWQFTVNRCGSMYVADDDLQELLAEGYVKNINKSLVILEYNCTPISADPGLTLLKDGLPVTGTEISVTDQSGDKAVAEHWYCTRYEIPVSSLKNEDGEYRDGIYTLSLESRDGAGHTSRLDKSDGYRLQFGLDHTAPAVLSVEGLEQMDNTNVRKLTIHLMDNLGLSRVKVLADEESVSPEGDYKGLAEATVTCVLPDSDTKQTVRVQVWDLAGNETEQHYETVSAEGITHENTILDTLTGNGEQTVLMTYKIKPGRCCLLSCICAAICVFLYCMKIQRHRR